LYPEGSQTFEILSKTTKKNCVLSLENEHRKNRAEENGMEFSSLNAMP
jgi:hypothetical protein